MSYHKATPTPQSSIMEPGTTSPGFPPNSPCPNPSTHTSTTTSNDLPSQTAFPIPPTPKPAALYTPPAPSPITTGISRRQRPSRLEGLAHKMARGWIEAINTFLEHHNNRPNVEHSAIQKAFKGMTLALEEIEEQKNLISADIIMETQLHIVVKRLADACIKTRLVRPPSERAAAVLEGWAQRFAGRISGADGPGDRMEIDG